MDPATVEERNKLREQNAKLQESNAQLKEALTKAKTDITRLIRGRELDTIYGKEIRAWGGRGVAPSEQDDIFISDIDRDDIAGQLGEHYTSGRLDWDDYQARLGKLYRRPLYQKDTAGLLDSLPPATQKFTTKEKDQTIEKLEEKVTRWRALTLGSFAVAILFIILLALA